MNYQLEKGIYIPQKEVTPISIFVDETNLLNESGFLQSAVVVPYDFYKKLLIPRCYDLLRKLGKDAKEFKGSNIKPGNVSIYKDFLQYFLNTVAQVSGQLEIHSIISIDSTLTYESDNYDTIFEIISGVLVDFKIKDEEHLAAECSRQILWLLNHYSRICNHIFANGLLLIFDNKHRYAQKLRSLRLINPEGLGVSVFWDMGDLLTRLTNKVLSKMKDKHTISEIKKFQFLWSNKEFGLQAADLLCHLMYNTLRYELGIKNDNTKLKRDILIEFLPDFSISKSLAAALDVKRDRENHEDILCIKNDLISTFRLLPQKENN
jgi:hypothetical protein